MVLKQSIYICSTSSFCGKSIISLGIALNLLEAGQKVGYLKPVGWEMGRDREGKRIDEDAQLMISALDLKLPMDVIAPVIFGTRFLEETEKITPYTYEEKILNSYEKVAEDKDVVLLEGPHSLSVGNTLNIDPISLSRKLKTPILIVAAYQNDITVDRSIWIKKVIETLGADFSGLILNRVLRTDLERIKHYAPRVFQEHGTDLLGIIPENVEMMAPTVREICETVHCELLTDETGLDNLVEDILVGAMSPESSLSYFRRSFRKAVITGGDRTDIQIAALETNLSALILTGNLYPDARVLSRAEELKVPVLLVPWDTYSTVKRLSQVTGRVDPRDEKKIALAKELVKEHMELERILKI